MNFSVDIKGWVEQNGRRLKVSEVEKILYEDIDAISFFGGEFVLRWNDCLARDHFGIIQDKCLPGVLICNGEEVRKIEPSYPLMELGQAIEKSVELRSDDGVVALSGGVDSALVAKQARRECLVVGMEGSHDLFRAKLVAKEFDLPLKSMVIPPLAIGEALQEVVKAIPRVTPVDASIATTLYFVTSFAQELGYERILAGQGADELFGGYARYLETETLAQDLERDFLGLAAQATRDQAVAALHGTYFSLPYLDVRVVQAAQAIPPDEKIKNGIRKCPLRDVAMRYMSPSIAYYEKKAMQYGSGVMREVKRLARKNGYKKSVQGYLGYLLKDEM